MAQNFWTAIWAFSACFVVTVAVSLVTKPREESELVGLVYSLTPHVDRETGPWYGNPIIMGAVVLTGAVVLNILFR
jgi:SSS family solute:Na+ symporter